jgi:hypothetical protein
MDGMNTKKTSNEKGKKKGGGGGGGFKIMGHGRRKREQERQIEWPLLETMKKYM